MAITLITLDCKLFQMMPYIIILKVRKFHQPTANCLRTTVPSVSYIRNSPRFWYYASLSTCCQNLEKKIGVTGKIWEKSGVKLLRDLAEKSVNFSTLAISSIRLLLVFGEEDQ